MLGLIIGAGEIGTALFNVLKEHHPTDIRDVSEPPELCDTYEILNICIPAEYIDATIGYIEQYKPKYCVIHSTVEVGTTEEIQLNVDDCIVMHSPINGIHPHLEEGIKTFCKFIGVVAGTIPIDRDMAELKFYFEKCGITSQFTDSRTTEYGKIMLTTLFGLNVLHEKAVYEDCKRLGVNFGVAYSRFIKEYNIGYRHLGYDFYNLPIYKHMEGKISGHCVISNAGILESPLTEQLLEGNEKLGKKATKPFWYNAETGERIEELESLQEENGDY